ncbi:hypothetical protein AB1Y20_011783 [Prymnesium parvum]|uniref:Uncharacterized protein n=1 Tax=Prymnesium parvum TaxID=97485 RepID=A0AB34IIE5_PRYPA
MQVALLCLAVPPHQSAPALSAGLITHAPKLHSSTVAVVPPDDVWESIQQARLSLRDKGMYRWPPHINLLYPFLPPSAFHECVAALAPVTSGISPFRVTLDALDTFGGRARGVLFCHPSSKAQHDALCDLQSALQAAVPVCDDYQRFGGFTPHLTLAHFSSREEAEQAKAALVGSWVPVSFDCSASVHLMHREGADGQFARAATLPLGGGASAGLPQLMEPAQRFPLMPAEEAEWIRDARLDARRRSPPRGSRSRRRRRPRRSAEERASIAARTPEDIEKIRAARRESRLLAEAAAKHKEIRP